jgi:hypothetical protein
MPYAERWFKWVKSGPRSAGAGLQLTRRRVAPLLLRDTDASSVPTMSDRSLLLGSNSSVGMTPAEASPVTASSLGNGEGARDPRWDAG